MRAALEGVCLQMRILVDRLEEVEPVAAVHATGGVFRSALWREVMAAALGRPLQIAADAEGTALGAAALALVALGRAATPAEGAALLSQAAAPPVTVPPDPALAMTYDRLRAAVPDMIAALGDAAGTFAGSPVAAANQTTRGAPWAR